MKQLYLILFVSLPLFLGAQNDSVFSEISYRSDSFYYTLGDTSITVIRQQYGNDSGLVFVNLHHNETTSLEAGHAFLKQYGGTLIHIENEAQRKISFRYKNETYVFDPNRIFTEAGVRATLQNHKSYDTLVADFVKIFGDSLLHHFDAAKTVIAVHNNTPDAYSILSYEKGGAFYEDAKAVHVVHYRDADDFFITTSFSIYKKLKDKDYNVVLQNNRKAKDDGSLSIYYGKKGRHYVNIEAEEGHFPEQLEMIEILITILQ